MAKPPILEVEATFLARDEGGRIQPPDLDAGRYMPHLVVRPAGIRATDDGLTEDYLGVAFLEGPRPLVAGRPGRFVVELMYHPRVDYDALREGAPRCPRYDPIPA